MQGVAVISFFNYERSFDKLSMTRAQNKQRGFPVQPKNDRKYKGFIYLLYAYLQSTPVASISGSPSSLAFFRSLQASSIFFISNAALARLM
jgi:hypothetical protein